MLTLRQLRAFVAASRSMSFTAAARQLNVSQSAVSLLIRDLESHLGVRLFERGRQLNLTPAGEEFARMADKLIADLDVSVSRLKDKECARRTVLRVGVGHLLAATLFSFVVERFRKRHPDISIEIHDCLVEQLPAMVLDKQVDFAIGSIRPTGDSSELRFEPLFQDSIHVTAIASGGQPAEPAGLAISPGAPLSWHRLENEPMILVNAGNRIWSAISATLAQKGLRLTVAHQVGLYSTGIALARRGQGRLLLPGFCARAPELGDLGISPLIEPVVRWDVSVLHRRGAPPGAHAEALIELLRDAVSGMPAPAEPDARGIIERAFIPGSPGRETSDP